MNFLLHYFINYTSKGMIYQYFYRLLNVFFNALSTRISNELFCIIN
jgi:uncharacterized UPF0160 family protein